MGGQLDREARVSQASDHGIVVSKVCGTGRGPRLHQPDRPAVAGEDLADRDSPLPHRRLPVGFAGGQVDLAKDDVDHAVEEVVLVGDVVIQRHRLDPDRFAELAHGQRGDAALVGQRDGGAQHPLPTQRRSGLAVGVAIGISP